MVDAFHFHAVNSTGFLTQDLDQHFHIFLVECARSRTCMHNMSSRPAITCHVLDTAIGKPAAGIPVTLTLLRPFGPSMPFTAVTNADGRVTAWQSTSGVSLYEVFAQRVARDTTVPAATSRRKEEAEAKEQENVIVWALRFDVGEYFQGEGFWTEVEIRFKTALEEMRVYDSHWHVPLLISPFSYTTYRGS